MLAEQSQLVQSLGQIVGPEHVSCQEAELLVVSSDESSHPPQTPLAVVWAESADSVSKIISYCADRAIPVTTRGAGSALEGSTIPDANGLVLDLSRMKQVRQFWPDDLQVEVEPGIVFDELNKFLSKEGLFFPPSPGGSSDYATVGGMVSTNASGIYSVRYGGSRDYLLGMTVVTGTGEILRLGSRAVKRSSGYNLVDLVAGSEGTLAVITSITLKLAGLPEHRSQSAFQFPTAEAAAHAVSDIRRAGIDIAAIEFLDAHLMQALNKLKAYGLDEVPSLFLEFHGNRLSVEANQLAAEELCRDNKGTALQLADGHRPWEIRHWSTEAIRHFLPGYSILRNDVVFPLSRLAEMVTYCYEQAEAAGIRIFAFGHVGMGLLHALMLARKENQAEWQKAQDLNASIVRKALSLGGSVSGEHGIGLNMKQLYAEEAGNSLELMRKIKRQFDPKGILNPGKIFDL